MELNNLWICISVCIILCTSTRSSATSAESRCHSGVETIASGRKARYVTLVPTLKDGYGLVDDRFLMAVKITEEFQYLQIHMNFGTSEYDPPLITAEQLGLRKDGLWHQLWIYLEPTNLPGVDNWHLYIKSDNTDEALDIDTGYVWHWKPYHPKLFRVFAKGKSYWIPHGDASVCNAVDAESRKKGYGSHGHLSIPSSALSGSTLLTERNLLEVLLLPLLLLIHMTVD